MSGAYAVMTVNIAVFRWQEEVLEILLLQRNKSPYQFQWALPGGKLDESDYSLEDAAIRGVLEETGVEVSHVRQVATYGNMGRDPRGRYVSVLYVAVLDDGMVPVFAGREGSHAAWFPVRRLSSSLAFDHDRLLRHAVEYACDGFFQ